MEEIPKRLDPTYVLREPAIRPAIRKLRFGPNSRGLDIGCRDGKITLLLSESTAPGGDVAGADISPNVILSSRVQDSFLGLARYSKTRSWFRINTQGVNP